MGLEFLLVMLGLGIGAVCADIREKVALSHVSDSCKGLFQPQMVLIFLLTQILKDSGRNEITGIRIS